MKRKNRPISRSVFTLIRIKSVSENFCHGVGKVVFKVNLVYDDFAASYGEFRAGERRVELLPPRASNQAVSACEYGFHTVCGKSGA